MPKSRALPSNLGWTVKISSCLTGSQVMKHFLRRLQNVGVLRGEVTAGGVGCRWATRASVAAQQGQPEVWSCVRSFRDCMFDSSVWRKTLQRISTAD